MISRKKLRELLAAYAHADYWISEGWGHSQEIYEEEKKKIEEELAKHCCKPRKQKCSQIQKKLT